MAYLLTLALSVGVGCRSRSSVCLFVCSITQKQMISKCLNFKLGIGNDIVSGLKSQRSRLGLGCSDTVGSGPDFAGGRPGANIEDGSSLIIHWSSGSHKRSTTWVNQYDIYFRNSIVCRPYGILITGAVTTDIFITSTCGDT